jgi:hypothetical protein
MDGGGRTLRLLRTLRQQGRRAIVAAPPAFRRAPDWQHAVHDTIEAMFRWGAEEPQYARMGGVEMYAAGKSTSARW